MSTLVSQSSKSKFLSLLTFLGDHTISQDLVVSQSFCYATPHLRLLTLSTYSKSLNSIAFHLKFAALPVRINSCSISLSTASESLYASFLA